MGDELVVYDESTDTVHHLNRTTAVVWRLCDGSLSGEDVKRRASEALGIDLPEETIAEAIALLDEASLLQPDLEATGVRGHRLSRRELLVRMGVVAAAIPVITTIVAPTPAAAATCAGQACDTSTAPCPGETTAGTGNCRCSAASGAGTCGACRGTGSNVGPGNARLCCSLAQNGTNCT